MVTSRLRPAMSFGLALIVGLALAFVVPSHWILVPRPAPMAADSDGHERYACPMFCSILDKLPADAKCPVCGMELAPVGASPLLDTHEQWMSGLQGARLQSLPLVHELRLFGEVAYDEESVSVVSARAQGWIEKLTAKVTWGEVEAGEPLFELYAPEVYQAVQELRVAKARGGELLQGARERLSLLGLDEQFLALAENADEGRAPRTVTYRAPRTGTVVRRRAADGAYTRVGEELFAVADLARVWVEFEAFEQDLHWVRTGAEVRVQDDVHPEQEWTGHVAFLDPVVDRASRTRRVRVVVDNQRRADGTWQLLPGARMQARVRVPVGADGGPANELRPRLAIPRSALLRTGLRDVVYVLYVEPSDPDGPQREYLLDPDRLPQQVGYELVQVQVGPVARRADQEGGEWFHPLLRVLPGADTLGLRRLREGHVLVLEGGLLIDSQAQLAGRPSLLFPEGRESTTDDPHAGH